MPANWLFWLLFHVFVAVALTLDLGVLHRDSHKIRLREAALATAVWISLAGVFAVLLYFFGHAMAADSRHSNATLSLEFVTGYLVEESMSIDNLFVFLLIFKFFQVPRELHHHVLFWGVVGALIARATFIFAGVALINRFHWIIYIFGAFLIYAGIGLMRSHKSIDPGKNPLLRFAQKHMRVTSDYESGTRFLVHREGVRYATQLLLVLIVVESTDIIFAVDSIPAVLAVTRNPFIVYTSNVFAILGLRSLYFALAGGLQRFHLLHYGLAIILIFVGGKMLASDWFEMPIAVALGVIAALLAGAVALSVVFPQPEEA
ncbi:MAG TPA: TerC family protein [candidate division Zixibacteria bacterium]|nr:TerC family protein [candidate division Zixibacteria bacterium]